MKKFFTLIAAVAMAASMNAQGTYAVQIGDNVKAGDQISSVENITLTYMENDGVEFAAGKKTTNWADADFGAYVCGKNSGKLVSDAAPTGCGYKFETAKAGSVTVAVQLSGNKGFHILDADFAEVAPASYNLPAAKDGASQEFTQNGKGENIIAEKSNGTVTFSVAEGVHTMFSLLVLRWVSSASSMRLAHQQASLLSRLLPRTMARHTTWLVSRFLALSRAW